MILQVWEQQKNNQGKGRSFFSRDVCKSGASQAALFFEEGTAPSFSSATSKTSSTFSTGYEFEFLLRFLGNVDEVFFVQLRNDDSGNSGAHRSQTFFFQSADRQNESAQSNLSRHGDIGTNRFVGEKRSERSKHGDAS